MWQGRRRRLTSVKETTFSDNNAAATTDSFKRLGDPPDLWVGCNVTVDESGNRIFADAKGAKGKCLILSEEATSSCPWSNERQAFVGSGCEYVERLECACLSLTTLANRGEEEASVEMCATYSFPKKVVVLQADQLFSVSLEDLSNIKTLVVVICSVFGCTAILAIASDVAAASARRKKFKKAIDGENAQAAGFRIEPNGAYTWTLNPAADEAKCNSVPQNWGMYVCRCVGVSVKRLRFCVPLISVKEVIEEHESTSRVKEVLRQAMCNEQPDEAMNGHKNTNVDNRSNGQLRDTKNPIREDVDEPSLPLERAIGTCLALAALAHGGLLSPHDFQLKARLASELKWSTLPAGLSFAGLLSRFCALCSPSGPLKLSKKWLRLADAFRLSLLQFPDGSFKACDAVAVSLRALSVPEVLNDIDAESGDTWSSEKISKHEKGTAKAHRWELLRRSMITRWRNLFFTEMKKEDEYKSSLTLQYLRRCTSKHLAETMVVWSKHDLISSKPDELPLDVWTSLLVSEWCKSGATLVLNPESDLPEASIDLGKLSDRFVDRQLEALGEDVEDDRARARTIIFRWNKIYEDHIEHAHEHVDAAVKKDVDKVRAERKQYWHDHFREASVAAVKGVCFAVLVLLKSIALIFLSTHLILKIIVIKPTDTFRRSERLWVVGTQILMTFTTAIWIHYQKSEQCCQQLRTHLQCSIDFTVPCYGELTCAKIKKLPQALGVPKCTAFPQKELGDVFAVIFIVLSIVLPVRMLLTAVFQAGGKAVSPSHFEPAAGADATMQMVLMQIWEAMVMMLMNPVAGMSRMTSVIKKVVVSSKRYVKRIIQAIGLRVFGKAAPKINRAMRIATAKSMKGLRRLSRRMSSSSSKIQTEKDGAAQHDDEKMLDGAGFDDEDPLEAAFKILDREQNLTKEARRACTRSARAAAEAPALKRLSLASLWSTRLDQLGILLIVLCWAITAWVIFAYGVLLYDNVGPGAEVDYMESWWQSFSTDVFGIESLKVMLRRGLFILVFRNVGLLLGQAEALDLWHEHVLEQGIAEDGSIGDADLDEVSDSATMDDGADIDVD